MEVINWGIEGRKCLVFIVEVYYYFFGVILGWFWFIPSKKVALLDRLVYM